MGRGRSIEKEGRRSGTGSRRLPSDTFTHKIIISKKSTLFSGKIEKYLSYESSHQYFPKQVEFIQWLILYISFIYSFTWEPVEVGEWGRGEEHKGAVTNICQHLHSPNKLTLHNSVYVLPSMVSGSL